MTSLLENLDGSDNEEINKLFPKCRPRLELKLSDVNLNTVADHHQSDDNENLNCVMNDNYVSSVKCSGTANEVIVSTMNEADLTVNGSGTSEMVGNKENSRMTPKADGENLKFAGKDSPIEENVDIDNSVVSGYEQGSNSGDLEPMVGLRGEALEDPEEEESPQNEALPDGSTFKKPRQQQQTEYKLRDSRIEIAGGREVFSQSKSKAARKRYSEDGLTERRKNSGNGELKRHSAEVLMEDKSGFGGFKTDSGVWELRSSRSGSGDSKKPRNVVVYDDIGSGFRIKEKTGGQANVGGVSASVDNNGTSLTSGDVVTETVFSTEVHSIRRLSDGRGPAVKQRPVVYEAPVSGSSEVVVFDDIGDWLSTQQQQKLYVGSEHGVKSRFNTRDLLSAHLGNSIRDSLKLNLNTDIGNSDDILSSDSSPLGQDSPAYHRHSRPEDFFKVVTSGSDIDVDSLSPERSKVMRVIGNLPIAEYEGSPRRYGPRHLEVQTHSSMHPVLPSAQSLLSSPSVYPPRPGFPQRVLTEQSNKVKSEQENVDGDNESSSKIVGVLGQVMKSTSNEQDSTGTEFLKESSPKSDYSKTSDTYDYLYEFSETRKVLEEFFKPQELTASIASPTHQDQKTPSEEVEQTQHPQDQITPVHEKGKEDFRELEYNLHRHTGNSYVGQRLAKGFEQDTEESPKKVPPILVVSSGGKFDEKEGGTPDLITLQDNEQEPDRLRERDIEIGEGNFLDLSVDNFDQETTSTNPETEDLGETEVGLQVGHSRNFTLSPETTDCDSNDIESELSLENEGSIHSSGRLYSSMPVLEDGLSSGHASDGEEYGEENGGAILGVGNNGSSVVSASARGSVGVVVSAEDSEAHRNRQRGSALDTNPTVILMKKQISEIEKEIRSRAQKHEPVKKVDYRDVEDFLRSQDTSYDTNDPELEALDPLVGPQETPPPPAPQPHRSEPPESVEAAIKDIRLTLQRTKTLPIKSPPAEEVPEENHSPVWVPRQPGSRRGTDSERKPGEEGGEEEEPDTDLETDRLLGQQRTDDQGFFDEKGWRKPKTRTVMPSKSSVKLTPPPPPPSSGDSGGANNDKTPSPQTELPQSSKNKKEKETGKKKGRNKEVMIHEPAVLIEGVLFRARYLGSTQLVCEGQPTKTTRMMQAEEAVSRIKANQNCSQSSQGYDDGRIDDDDDCGDENEHFDEGEVEDGECNVEDDKIVDEGCHSEKNQSVQLPKHTVLPLGTGATGTVFRLQFLGSVDVDEESIGKKRRKRLKKNMVEEAVTKIKAPEGETQPSTEVDLFISTEKIMVLNTDLKEIMMDHALRTISYIADIGDLVVLMARRRYVPQDVEEAPKINRTPKMICHVFESEEAQFIAQSIGQAFQVAYMEFLKANGIEDHSFVKEMDYQEVLNSQEIFGDELQMFAKKEMQKEVVVPKAKGEILGVVIVESGWGSMLPTVVIANLAPAGAAARCGQLNIGDQIIAINGVSLVGLPLSTCQNYIKNTKNQTVVKLTVVPCAPVVEVKIKRPDTKYQLGFSVQNGVICSLLRGGIAERGGVRVGHRIIEINNQSVVAVPHEKIVNLLATSVGEIHMKTMPTSMFRLLTGQETPVYI